MAKPIRDHFNAVQKRLLMTAHEVGILKHRGSIGSAREIVISEFLEAALPREFDLSAGEIIASDGLRSGQVDIMMISKYAPQFRLAPGISIAVLHSVAAAMEIKSNLTSEELESSLVATKRIKSLSLEPRAEPWPWSAQLTLGGPSVELPHIPVSIVAFHGIALNRALSVLERSASENAHLPNTVTCLEEGYTLTINDGWIYRRDLLPEKIRTARYIQTQEHALATLYDYLMKALQAWSYARPRTPMTSYLYGGED